MVEPQEAKHILSLKYDIAAGDLDESIVPLMIGISSISDDLKKSLIAYDVQIKNIEKLMNQKVPQIYCDKPKTALLVGIGKVGSIAMAVSIFLSIFWMGLVVLKTHETKYQHFENLSEIIKFDKKRGEYFIPKKDYRVLRDGIILNKKR